MIQLWNNYQFRKKLNEFVSEYAENEEAAFPLFESLVNFVGQGVPTTSRPAMITPVEEELTASEVTALSFPTKPRERRTKAEIAAGVPKFTEDTEDVPDSKAPIATIKAKLRSMAATPGKRAEIRAKITPEEQRRIDAENELNKVDIMTRCKESAAILLNSVKKDGFDSNGERKVVLAGHRYAGANLNEYMASLGYKIAVRKSMMNIHGGSDGESGAGSVGSGWEVVVTR